jgi:hypothetical protein
MFIREVSGWLLPGRTAPEYTRAQRALVAQYVTAATIRTRMARDVASSEAPVVSAILFREAVILLLRAALAARDPATDGPKLTGLDATTALPELRRTMMRDVGDDDRRVDEAIRPRDPLYLDSLDEIELRRVCEALTRETEWLESQIDLRSSSHVTGTKVGRLGAVVLVVGYLGYWAATSAFPPRNLALGKPVRLSSQEPGTPDPAGLVDGVKGHTYGGHTQVAQRPGWAVVDLGREVDLKRIVVYNRGDTNLNDGLPYSIDLSSDGTQFNENVARREAPFGDGSFLSPPWMAAIHARARYVRVRATWYLALSEVEVF